MFCTFKRTETDDCIKGSKHTDFARSYWLAKSATMIMWGDLSGTINILLSPHTSFLALTCRKILSYLTELIKFMSETPVPISVQIHTLSKGGDSCLSFSKALGDVVGSTSNSTAPQLREIRDKYCPEKT